MNKLNDKAFRIWLVTFILIGILFILPAEWVEKWIQNPVVTVITVRIVTVALSLILAMLAFGRYASYAMDSGNKAATYNNPAECEDDINNDVFTHNILMGISWIFIAFPLGMLTMVFILGLWNTMFSLIHLDWMIGFFIIAVFNFRMASLRNRERVFTVRNALQSMERKNPMSISP